MDNNAVANCIHTRTHTIQVSLVAFLVLPVCVCVRSGGGGGVAASSNREEGDSSTEEWIDEISLRVQAVAE
uniref:Secreted protein n=1 Tax=Trichogramma kaykai TaxID=54128 RepID=A0ABD2WG69_9HYME